MEIRNTLQKILAKTEEVWFMEKITDEDRGIHELRQMLIDYRNGDRGFPTYKELMKIAYPINQEESRSLRHQD